MHMSDAFGYFSLTNQRKVTRRKRRNQGKEFIIIPMIAIEKTAKPKYKTITSYLYPLNIYLNISI